MDFIIDIINDEHISIVGICETWLTPLDPDSIICIPNYDLYRNDSPSNSRKHGVCAYVRGGIKCREVTTDLPNTLVIYIFDEDIYYVLVYRPPSASSEENETLINFFCNFCPWSTCNSYW